MKHKVTEINIVPIKPQNGLVGFASLVLDGNLYLGSIGIFTRPEGGYRLTYPTKPVGIKNLNIFYPINRDFAKEIEQAVVNKFEEVMNPHHDRHNCPSFE